ncbi:FecR domain-containing protein [Foetidibacter luteolus]|uniref:FecR domain-containing protein n=1 Tax=Foetidibacter luteolus TaxID=2608880 RepID=UPI00129AAAB3|nr:FecR domain-containing protein [Foetidibacter luteolus]
MQISEKLIEDFLNGDCSEEERQLVAAWLRENPARLEHYLTEKSWDEFKPVEQDAELSARMLKNIDAAIDKKVVRLPVRKWLAAASVIVAAGVSILYFSANNKTPAPLAGKRADVPAVTPVLATVRNADALPKEISLPDGSVVTLTAGSSISYQKPFVNNRREIYLDGEAKFNVAKDPARPFTVHAKSISTTALGTVFTVNGKHMDFISVKLFEGKVVVSNSNKAANMKDVYLTPGQQLTFNNQSFSVAIQPIRIPTPVQKSTQAVKPVPVAILQFDNKPLEEIFTTLENTYNVTIHFKSEELADMNFTGIHKTKSETLEDFLNTIATLNDLTVNKTKRGYTIIRTK